MIIKINKNKILIYLFALLVVLPYFSSNIGISLGGVKINVADIAIGSYIIKILLNKNKLNLNKNMLKIIGWKCLLLLFAILVPIGLLNGASLSEQIRLLRNLLYIVISYYMFAQMGKDINDTFFVEYISIISILDCIINTVILHNNSNWYQFYRANGVLNVFLFCFLICKIWKMNKKEALLGTICCIGLIYSSFLSQERTQILTIGIALIIAIFYQIYVRLKNWKNIKVNVKIIFKIALIIILSSIIVYYVLKIDFVKNYIEYYTTYRLANGNLLQNDTLQSDGSFSGRLFQISTILKGNLNPLYILCGRGTCAHYFAIQGDTYIVDSAVLWIFKDLGIIGTILIVIIFKNMLKGCKNVSKDSRLAIYASGVSLIVFSLYNPSFLQTSSAAFTFGLYLFLKYKSINEKEKTVENIN